MKTIYKNIRFIFLVVGISLFLSPATAQTTNVGYFMKSQHSKTSLNPALRPEQGYIGLPGFSNLFVDFKTNTFNLEHFIYPWYPKARTFLHEDITPEQFLNKISDNNYFDFDVSYTIASVGFYNESGFWTIDLGTRVFSSANVPYDVFKFAKQGLMTSDGEPVSNYNLKNIRGTATGYIELGVGHSRPFLDDKLVVGLKAKVLFGIANMDFNVKKLTMNTGENQWSIESEAVLKGSLPGFKPKYDEDGIFNGFEENGSAGLSGFGLGFDLGATYKLSGIMDDEILDKFTFSAALTDIGFISWGKKSSMYLATNPTKTVLTGNYDISFGSDDNSLGDQFNSIGDTLKNAVNLVDTYKNGGQTTALRVNMNLGLEYEFIANKLSAGILSTTRFNPSHAVTEFTLAGVYKPVDWFETGLSYSFVHSNFKTIGLALNIVPAKGFNMFFASDYIIPHVNSDFIPTSSKALNFQLGFSIPLGNKITN